MKIPKAHYGFSERPALICALGSQHGILYAAHTGEIKKISEHRRDLPHYTDHEGRFQVSTGRMTVRTGAVREPKRHETQKAFMKEMGADISKVVKRDKIEEIHFFVPRHKSREYQDMLPQYVRKHIIRVYLGNYAPEHPLRLVEIITDRTPAADLTPPAPHERTAHAILKKGRVRS